MTLAEQEMELSEAVIEGIQVAGSASTDDKAFQKLVKNVLATILESENEVQQYEKESASSKEAFFGLTTLFLELAKVDADEASISSVLEECKFGPERAQFFTMQYMESKNLLRSSLERVGSSPPHIVDARWRLDYYLKNNHVERVSRPEYLISLTTQSSESNSVRGVKFACTQEQLQDLILKLKDATKTLDKYVQH